MKEVALLYLITILVFVIQIDAHVATAKMVTVTASDMPNQNGHEQRLRASLLNDGVDCLFVLQRASVNIQYSNIEYASPGCQRCNLE